MIVDWQNISAMDVLNGLVWAVLIVFLFRHGYQLVVARRDLKVLKQKQKALGQVIETETRQLKQLVDAFEDDKGNDNKDTDAPRTH